MTPTETRLRLLKAGYFPLPLFGKRPVLDKWSQKFDTNPDEIRMWTKQWADATNTGFLCRHVPTFDADIMNPEAIEAIRELVATRFADNGCVLTRVGKPPKFAIPFRTDKPFKKIINTPTMRPDGTLLTEQGYDKKTQLWHKSAADAVLPPIPDAPTKSDAERALEFLDDLLSEFPFVDRGLDRSVAIAGIMTPVLRGAFPVAPLFFIAKPEAGTGASYFVRLVGMIATGQDATPLVASADPKELQKELSAKAFEGRPILNLNNLTFDLESALLCQMLTEGVVDIRPFGKNTQTVSCDCRSTTVFANGNNIRIVGDLVRRTVTCRMDAKAEQPELREFKHNPVELVKKNRGAYLAAVFTIARAFIAAGSPDVSVTALAGFEGWSQKVRHPLIWLGRPDPARSMDDNRALDPEREELRELIDALAKCFGAAEFTAADVLNWANRGGSDNKLAHPELITVFSRDGRNVNAKAIGKLLMKYRDRVQAAVPSSELTRAPCTRALATNTGSTGPRRQRSSRCDFTYGIWGFGGFWGFQLSPRNLIVSLNPAKGANYIFRYRNKPPEPPNPQI